MCPELSDPANGEVTVTGQIEGSTAAYSCAIGYTLIGDDTRICRNGVWSGTEPVCLEGMCSPLSDPADGTVTVSGQTHGSTATYTCNAGYQLVGDDARTCVHGIWTGQTPTCLGIMLYRFTTIKSVYWSVGRRSYVGMVRMDVQAKSLQTQRTCSYKPFSTSLSFMSSTNMLRTSQSHLEHLVHKTLEPSILIFFFIFFLSKRPSVSLEVLIFEQIGLNLSRTGISVLLAN